MRFRSVTLKRRLDSSSSKKVVRRSSNGGVDLCLTGLSHGFEWVVPSGFNLPPQRRPYVVYYNGYRLIVIYLRSQSS